MSKEKQQEEVVSFEDTMAELEAFGKAMAAKPMTKAKPTKGQENVNTVEEGMSDDGEDRGDESDYTGETMGKSAVSSDRTEEMDAEAFLKQANALLGKTVMKSVQGLVDNQNQVSGMLIKALVAQGKAMQAICEDIKAFRSEAEAQGSQPGMRKSAVSVHERKPSGAAPHQGQIDENGNHVVKSLLAKSFGPNSLVKQGVLSPAMVATLEHLDNRGQGLSPELTWLRPYAENQPA